VYVIEAHRAASRMFPVSKGHWCSAGKSWRQRGARRDVCGVARRGLLHPPAMAVSVGEEAVLKVQTGSMMSNTRPRTRAIHGDVMGTIERSGWRSRRVRRPRGIHRASSHGTGYVVAAETKGITG